MKNALAYARVSTKEQAESVDRGRGLRALDAVEVERAITEGWIKIAKLTRRQSRRIQRLISKARVGFGEAEALTLAKDKGITALLDDKEARALAKS